MSKPKEAENSYITGRATVPDRRIEEGYDGDQNGFK